MKFNAVSAALGAALLAGSAVADEAQKVVKDESSSAESSSTSPQLPTFTVQFFFFLPLTPLPPQPPATPTAGGSSLAVPQKNTGHIRWFLMRSSFC